MKPSLNQARGENQQGNKITKFKVHKLFPCPYYKLPDFGLQLKTQLSLEPCNHALKQALTAT
jgi:hypothetical protein